MSQNELHIVYCKFNEPEVISATNRLKKTGFTFHQINSANFEAEQNFAAKLAGLQGKILLFLSDNFLKSITCLNGTIPILQNLITSGKALPVLLDGHYPNDTGDGGYKLVSTQISRVGHILKYMNYWQQAYIKLRKERSTIPAANKEAFEQKLKDVKSISSNIAAFLAFLKEENCMNYDSFKMNHFEAFFQEFSTKDNFERFTTTDTEEDVVAVAITHIPPPKQAVVRGEHIEPVSTLKIIGKIPADLITIDNPELTPISAQAVEAVAPVRQTLHSTITVEHAGKTTTIEELFVEEPEQAPRLIHSTKKITATPAEVFKNQQGQSVDFTYTELPTAPNQSLYHAEEVTENGQSPMTAYVTVMPTDTVGTVRTSVSKNPPIPIDHLIASQQKVRTHYSLNNQEEVATLPAKKIQATPPALQPLQEGEKVIMVMGATTPIGRAAVTAFAEQGCRVILTGNRFSQLYKMQRDLEQQYQKEVQLLPFDPNVAISMEAIVEDLEPAWQNIDLLLNISDLTTISSTMDWHQLLHVNIQGLYNITNKIVPYLKTRQKGQIINLAALDNRPERIAISKALQQGISAFTETIQLDLQAHHIKVSQLFPEYTGNQDAAINEAIAQVIYFISVQPDSVTIRNVTMGE